MRAKEALATAREEAARAADALCAAAPDALIEMVKALLESHAKVDEAVAAERADAARVVDAAAAGGAGAAEPPRGCVPLRRGAGGGSLLGRAARALSVALRGA